MSEIINPEVMQLVKQEESIKVEKNSKGYNWEYRLIGTVEEQIKRIDFIENFLKTKFMEVK